MEPMVIFGVIIVVLCGYKTVVDMLGDGRYIKRDLAIARQLARKCRAGIAGHHKLLIKAAYGKLPLENLAVAPHIHEKAGLFIKLHSPHPGHRS